MSHSSILHLHPIKPKRLFSSSSPVLLRKSQYPWAPSSGNPPFFLSSDMATGIAYRVISSPTQDITWKYHPWNFIFRRHRQQYSSAIRQKSSSTSWWWHLKFLCVQNLAPASPDFKIVQRACRYTTKIESSLKIIERQQRVTHSNSSSALEVNDPDTKKRRDRTNALLRRLF